MGCEAMLESYTNGVNYLFSIRKDCRIMNYRLQKRDTGDLEPIRDDGVPDLPHFSSQ